MSEEDKKLAVAIRDFIKTAIHNNIKGDTRNYNTLVQNLSSQAEPAALCRWYQSLCKCISSLPDAQDRRFRALHDAFFAFDWVKVTLAYFTPVAPAPSRSPSVKNGATPQAQPKPKLSCQGDEIDGFFVPTAFQTQQCVFVPDLENGLLLPALMAHSEFLVNLALAQGSLLNPVLKTFVKQFLVTTTSVAASAHPSIVSEKVAEAVARAVHAVTHRSLATLLELIPSAVTMIVPVLVQLYPHKRQPVVAHLMYSSNLLAVCEYASVLRDRVVTLITERIVLLDVEVDLSSLPRAALAPPAAIEITPPSAVESPAFSSPLSPQYLSSPQRVLSAASTFSLQLTPASHASPSRESSALEDIAFEETLLNQEALVELSRWESKEDEPEDLDHSGPAGESDSAMDATRRSPAEEENLTMANKLDCVMKLMFQFLDFVRSQPEKSEQVFISLLRVFESVIIRTHKSRHTQFLLHYMCSFDMAFSEELAKRLLQRCCDRESPPADRLASAAYLASFIARAPFLRDHSTFAVVSIILTYLTAYLQVHETANGTDQISPLDARQHSLFYSMCQAVFYIFSRRQRSFMSILDPETEEFATFQSNLDRIIFSPLNPLRFCVPSVVLPFAMCCKRLSIVDCTPLLLENEAKDHVAASAAVTSPERQSFDSPAAKSHLPHHHHRTRSASSSLVHEFTQMHLSHLAHSSSASALTAGHSVGAAPSSSSANPELTRWTLESFFPFDPYRLVLSHSFVSAPAVYVSQFRSIPVPRALRAASPVLPSRTGGGPVQMSLSPRFTASMEEVGSPFFSPALSPHMSPEVGGLSPLTGFSLNPVQLPAMAMPGSTSAFLLSSPSGRVANMQGSVPPPRAPSFAGWRNIDMPGGS